MMHLNVEAPDAAPILIRKYANRRLYNTATSSHVNLESVTRLARDGADFVVVEDKTGQDITREILTQIMLAREANDATSLLPTSFLIHLIRLYGGGLQPFVQAYLGSVLSALASEQQTGTTPTGGHA
jgi:polyhydroxyalkanoate synthesis repressor PhaR